jgi:hypothetical protein
MIYLKSLLAGLVAVFSVATLVCVGIVIYLSVFASKERGAGAIGWNPISVMRPGPVLIMLAVFVAGFLWEFSRVSR